jgi:DNA-directed RNA polymerase specialized sigma24 family protein
MRSGLRVESDAAFSAFVASNRSGLLHLAVALTGDRSSAEDLVQIALSRTYSHWAHLIDQQPLAYARRNIVNANHDRWRRRSVREQASMVVPEPGSTVRVGGVG